MEDEAENVASGSEWVVLSDDDARISVLDHLMNRSVICIKGKIAKEQKMI